MRLVAKRWCQIFGFIEVLVLTLYNTNFKFDGNSMATGHLQISRLFLSHIKTKAIQSLKHDKFCQISSQLTLDTYKFFLTTSAKLLSALVQL